MIGCARVFFLPPHKSIWHLTLIAKIALVADKILGQHHQARDTTQVLLADHKPVVYMGLRGLARVQRFFLLTWLISPLINIHDVGSLHSFVGECDGLNRSACNRLLLHLSIPGQCAALASLQQQTMHDRSTISLICISQDDIAFRDLRVCHTGGTGLHYMTAIRRMKILHA
jgi:hypothetical protein